MLKRRENGRFHVVSTWNTRGVFVRFATELKNHLKIVCNRLSAEHITDEQLCWEYIKYEIRKFSIHFSKQNKTKKKKTRAEIVTLENKFKKLEQNSDRIFNRN